MKLLSDNELKWSPIVANSRMNRQRIASGVNSYEQEIGFIPEQFVYDRIKRNGNVSWLDICCGKGNALIQAAKFLTTTMRDGNATLVGIDIIDDFSEIPPGITCVEFKTGIATELIGDEKYDLITCIHGLHYMGDKLGCISKIAAALTSNGVFIANMDPANIWIDGEAKTKLLQILRRNRIDFNSRKKLIRMQGNRDINFHLNYLGADDTAGANYTGQEAVNSHYTSK